MAAGPQKPEDDFIPKPPAMNAVAPPLSEMPADLQATLPDKIQADIEAQKNLYNPANIARMKKAMQIADANTLRRKGTKKTKTEFKPSRPGKS